jgi:TonB family protein
VHSFFRGLGPGDEPPYPIGGLKGIYGPLAEAAQKYTIRGSAIVAVRIDSEGKVEEARIYKASDPAVGEAVARAAFFSKFKPAVRNGSPVPGEFPISVQFD